MNHNGAAFRGSVFERFGVPECTIYGGEQAQGPQLVEYFNFMLPKNMDFLLILGDCRIFNGL